jgi:DNA-binding PadR family transcriptional regulator
MNEDLSRSAFIILLSLSDRPRHGLGSVEEVEERTSGAVKLGPGTLYGTLKRLLQLGYVRETDAVPDPQDDDPRRRYYQVTAEGRGALAEEAARMRALVEIAGIKRVLHENGK